MAYRRARGSSFWTATPGGVEEWLLLDAEAVQRGAPVAAWDVRGGALTEREGVIEIADATGAARLRVTAPAAYAAGGREVRVRLTAVGERIALFVDAEGEQVLVDPEWTDAQNLAVGRRRHTAVRFGAGVMVAGGYSGTSVLRDVELYDPETKWTSPAAPVNRMGSPRTEHAMVALEDGSVLVVGGNEGTARTSCTTRTREAAGSSERCRTRTRSSTSIRRPCSRQGTS